MNVASATRFRMRDREKTTFEVHMLPSQGELLHLTHPRENGEPHPVPIRWTERLTEFRFFLQTQKLQPSWRFFEKLHLHHRRRVQFPISDRDIEHMPRKFILLKRGSLADRGGWVDSLSETSRGTIGDLRENGSAGIPEGIDTSSQEA